MDDYAEFCAYLAKREAMAEEGTFRGTMHRSRLA